MSLRPALQALVAAVADVKAKASSSVVGAAQQVARLAALGDDPDAAVSAAATAARHVKRLADRQAAAAAADSDGESESEFPPNEGYFYRPSPKVAEFSAVFATTAAHWSHAYVVRNLARLLRCRAVPDAGSFYSWDLAVPCAPSAYYLSKTVLAAFGLAAFGVGLPVAAVQLARQHAAAGAYDTNLLNEAPRVARLRGELRLAWLLAGYDLPFWEGLVMARKALMSLIINIFPERPQLAGYCCVYVMEVALALHLAAMPLGAAPAAGRVETAALVVQLVILHAGLVLATIGGAGQYGQDLVTGGIAAAVGCVLFLGLRSARAEYVSGQVARKMERLAQQQKQMEKARRREIATQLTYFAPMVRQLPEQAAMPIRAAIASGELADGILEADASPLRLRHLKLMLGLEGLKSRWKGTPAAHPPLGGGRAGKEALRADAPARRRLRRAGCPAPAQGSTSVTRRAWCA